MKIILFEDTSKEVLKILPAIKKAAGSQAQVVRFEPSQISHTSTSYEDRLVKEMDGAKYRGATLWVTDRDLSLTKNYQGLSETIVSKVADELGVPICKYAQGTADSVFERQREWGDSQIVLDCSDAKAMAKDVLRLAKGFEAIAKKLKPLIGKKITENLQTPAAVMALLLEHEREVDRIALYSSGDQKMVRDILPFLGSASQRKGLGARLPSLFGYWLYDSILRFPGLFVNEIAAASYLNISVPEFQKSEIQRLFAKALYQGPFSDADQPYWWRSELDALISTSQAADGNSFAQKKLKKKISPCLDSGKRAGWYCMVKKVPVSEENSVGGISWFPPGADLARVRKDIFDQAGPWLGLYNQI